MDDLKFYKENGFLIIKNVFNTNDLKAIRSILINEFKSKKNPKVLDVYQLKNSNKFLSELYLSDKLYQKLYDIFHHKEFGKIFILPPFSIMRNFFPKHSSHTWHIDASGEFRYKYCKDRIYAKDYLFAKVGIYLQNNSEYGGQIDIIRGSNRTYGKRTFKSFLAKISLKMKMKFVSKLNIKIKKFFEKKFLNYEKLNLNLGDVVVFDSRVYHRGSPISLDKEKKLSEYDGHYIKETKNDETKFALYFQFGNLQGLQSYWYDRGKRLSGDSEREQWEKTKNHIKNYYLSSNKDIPNEIKNSLEYYKN